MSRSVAPVSNSTLTAPPATPKQSLPQLLLANLRLLDLDLRADWPDLTTATFSTKETQQSQKQRIKCTEWVLYRLFELWDPAETRDKLQPFFPPLEPLQSLNLRGALFRALNELKKNSVLGRDAVLRKTMLDECKGEKLMELLVVFSTTVLRRQVAGQSRNNRTVATRLASAPMLSAAQQGSLIPLSIAHAASLGDMLRKREEKRQRYAQFDELLDGKREQLRQRVKTSVQHKRRESNVNEEALVKKVVQDNWTGKDRWAQALLAGDDGNAGDLPLQKPFDEVWEAVSNGQPLGGDTSNPGLLASLERRVHMQKERLQMWHEFHEGLKDTEDDGRCDKFDAATTKFEFDRHQTMQLSPKKVLANHDSKMDMSNKTYGDLLNVLRRDIMTASKSRRMGGAGWSRKKEGTAEYRSHDLFSPVKGGPPIAMGTAERMTQTNAPKVSNILDDRPTLLATRKPELNGFKIKRLGRNDSKTEATLEPKTESATTVRKEVAMPSPTTPEATPIKITEPSPLREEETEEETAAERIISSVVNATPSPAKPMMSLTERTRMSMAFFKRAEAPDSIDSGIAMAPPAPSDDDDDALPALTKKGGGDVQRRVSLLERTRLSMAAVPAHQPQSRKSMKLRQSSRQSLFPINQFETPGKPRAMPSPIRDTTPTEKLFSDEAEYASVFKSRPRIALSPVPFTPEDGHNSLDDSLDLDEGDSDTERVAASNIANSPLMARRRLAAG